jgi:putative membrane protein
VLAVIFAWYSIARILEILPTSIPQTAIVALDVLGALAFALVDGTRAYRVRGILVFAGICIVVGNVAENLGVATGFPFGRYYFVNLMGPKLWHVPVLLGLAYIGMAYVSWTVARAILGPVGFAGARVLAVPLLASAVMTSWDLAQDPVWATVLHGWVWRDGGAWFGVPASNYLGWYGTVFVIYLLLAVYLRKSGDAAGANGSAGPALLFYALCAAGNVLQVLPRQATAAVADPTGRVWQVADILHGSALVSIFVMGGFAVLGWMRRAGRGL